MRAKSSFALPEKLVFTAFHVALTGVAGVLACSSSIDTPSRPATEVPADASTDARADAAPDASDDASDAGDAQADVIDEQVAMDAPADGNGDACTEEYFCIPSTKDASCPGAICSQSDCPADSGCEVVA
jgi:hypothetical protein